MENIDGKMQATAEIEGIHHLFSSILLLVIGIRKASLIVIVISFIVTNLVGMVVLLPATDIWMFQLGSANEVYMMLDFVIVHRPRFILF